MEVGALLNEQSPAQSGTAWNEPSDDFGQFTPASGQGGGDVTSASPHDEQPVRGGIGGPGGPLSFEELIERELAAQGQSTNTASNSRASRPAKAGKRSSKPARAPEAVEEPISDMYLVPSPQRGFDDDHEDGRGLGDDGDGDGDYAGEEEEEVAGATAEHFANAMGTTDLTDILRQSRSMIASEAARETAGTDGTPPGVRNDNASPFSAASWDERERLENEDLEEFERLEAEARQQAFGAEVDVAGRGAFVGEDIPMTTASPNTEDLEYFEDPLLMQTQKLLHTRTGIDLAPRGATMSSRDALQQLQEQGTSQDEYDDRDAWTNHMSPSASQSLQPRHFTPPRHQTQLNEAREEQQRILRQEEDAARKRAAAAAAAGPPAEDTPPTSSLVSRMFKLHGNAGASGAGKTRGSPSRKGKGKGKGKRGVQASPKSKSDQEVDARLTELEAEIAHFKKENAKIEGKRKQMLKEVELERQGMVRDQERRRAKEAEEFEAYKQGELKKIRKEKRLLEQSSKTAIFRSLNEKKDKEALLKLQQEFSQYKDNAKLRESKYKATIERLRKQVNDANSRTEELATELRHNEQARLDRWEAAERSVLIQRNKQEQAVAQQVERAKAAEAARKLAQEKTSSADTKARAKAAKRAAAKKPTTRPTTKPSRTASAGEQRLAELSAEHDPVPSRDVYEPADGPHHASQGASVHHPHDNGITATRPRSVSNVSDTLPIQEKRHPDGKIEQVMQDGRRVTIFRNSTRKEHFADGSSMVHFTNGDTKRVANDGRVIYHYFEADTLHTTFPDGMELFQFPNGQTERHYPDGGKDIFFPDDTMMSVGGNSPQA